MTAHARTYYVHIVYIRGRKCSLSAKPRNFCIYCGFVSMVTHICHILKDAISSLALNEFKKWLETLLFQNTYFFLIEFPLFVWCFGKLNFFSDRLFYIRTYFDSGQSSMGKSWLTGLYIPFWWQKSKKHEIWIFNILAKILKALFHGDLF